MVVSRLVLGCLVLLAAGCAARPAANDAEAQAEFRELNDPYEPANRFFYAVNDGLDTYVLRPVAVAYRDVVPGAVRRPIRNLLGNLGTPAGFANEVLQGHPRLAGDKMVRFVVNSTAGVGGLFDVAKEVGYPDKETDFGLTLAVWGRGRGAVPFPAGAGAEQSTRRRGFCRAVRA